MLIKETKLFWSHKLSYNNNQIFLKKKHTTDPTIKASKAN